MKWGRERIVEINAVPDLSGGLFVVMLEYDAQTPESLQTPFMYRVNRNGTFPAGWDTSGVRLVPRAIIVDTNVSLIPDGEAGYFVAWTEGNASGTNLSARVIRLDGDGLPRVGWPAEGISVDTPTLRNSSSILLPDLSGGVISVANSRADDNLSTSVYAKRINADGSLVWLQSPNGVILRSGPLYTFSRGAVSDGAGGAYAVIYRAPDDNHVNMFVQRVLVDGTIAPGWPSKGVPIVTGPGIIAIDVDRADDGQGGVFVSWSDYRAGVGQFRVQRILPNGLRAPGWPDQGLVVGGVTTINIWGSIAPDTRGGVYGMWWGVNSTGYYTYLDHVGALGLPAPGWTMEGVLVEEDPLDLYDYYPGFIIPDGRGGAIACWERVGGGGADVTRLQRLSPEGAVATNLSLVTSDVGLDHVSVEWFSSSPDPAGYALERDEDGQVWVRTGQVSADGAGHIRFEDRAVAPGHRYGYRLRPLAGGGPVPGSEVWFTTLTGVRFALEGVQPNPCRSRDLSVRFSLAPSAPASLGFYDVTGRRLWERGVASQTGGDQILQVGAETHLAAGMYWLRLRQGAQQAMTRVVVVE